MDSLPGRQPLPGDLVDRNRALVPCVLRRYFHNRPEQEREELEAVGYLALIEAAVRFDPDQGKTFSTYAVPCIHLQMISALAGIRAGAFSCWAVQSGRVRIEDLPQTVSLDAPTAAGGSGSGAGEGGAALGDLQSDEGQADPETVFLRSAAVRSLWGEVWGLLPEREAAVVALYFAGGDGEGMTFAQIGQRLGISRQRVHQMHGKALDILRTRIDPEAMRATSI